MDFTLGKEHEMARTLFHDFAEKEVKPLAQEVDEEERFPVETVEKMAKNGFLGIPVPKEYGGQGCDPLTYAMCVEELSKVCGTTGVIVSAHTSLCMDPIMTFGTEEQKQKFLVPLAKGEKLGAFGLTEPGAGTDAQGQQTKAVLDGDEWVLNGSKCFITNGKYADTYIVIAVTGTVEKRGKMQKEISAFIVEKGTPGFTFGTKEKKMGIRGSATYELIFTDCLIGHIGKGLGRHFLFQQAEDHQTVVFVQFFQQLGQVGRLLFLGDFAQLDILLFHQHFQQAALGQHFGVGLDLFVTGLFFFGVPHILLEVFGGLLAQVFGQLPADFRRDICGQFGHRERCFRGRALFFFQFHLCSSLPFPADRTAHKTKSAACFPQRAVLPAARTRLRPFSPLRSACTAPLTGQKRRTQLLFRSAVPQLIRVFDYDPGPLSCVHLLKILSTFYYSVRKKAGQP